MEKIIASFLLMGLAFLVAYLTMVFGWGLEVKSWPWLIGCWIASTVIFALQRMVMSDTDSY